MGKVPKNKMLKPQKSNKHKKMKAIDPFYVGDRPVDRHADKFNLKPKREEGQEYSRSVQELAKLKQAAKIKVDRKKKRNFTDNAEGINDNLSAMERGCGRPFKQAPNFKRRKGETESSFFCRVDRETMAVVNKAQFEDKFNIGDDAPELTDDKEKNNTTTQSNKGKKRLVEKKRKLKESKNNKLEDRIGGFAGIKDVVQFGDVVQGPPTLSVRPRKATEVDSTKLGSRKLLLSAMMTNQDSPTDADKLKKTSDKKGEQKTTELRKSIKRKNMTPAARHALDTERERTILLYRQMKESKQQPLIDDY